MGPLVYQYAGREIAYCLQTRSVETDVVPANGIVCRVCVGQQHADAAVTADHVSPRVGAVTYGVELRPILDGNAINSVSQGSKPAGVCADVVPDDSVVVSTRIHNHNALDLIVTDHVAAAFVSTADDIPLSTAGDKHAGMPVPLFGETCRHVIPGSSAID